MPQRIIAESRFTIAHDRMVEAIDMATKRGISTKQGMETIAQRLARLRKERGMTQAEIAKQLGVAQPVVSDYERGELRLHGELIVQLAQILRSSADELLGFETKQSGNSIKNRRFLRRIQQIDHLPKRDQQALLRIIDNTLRSASGAGQRVA